MSLEKLPVAVALILLAAGGIFLLNRADAQARDTTRKHHLEDIEQALYFARTLNGTYPPYDQTSWCGRLDSQDSSAVQQQIEAALRQQHAKYANPEKPFPQDPNGEFVSQGKGYYYWKHSPANFELFASLETDPSGERSTTRCPTNTDLSPQHYDYGIASLWRQTQ